MKLNEYIIQLTKLTTKHGNKTVAYASDDEGNSFHKVIYIPSVQKVSINYGKEHEVVVIN